MMDQLRLADRPSDDPRICALPANSFGKCSAEPLTIDRLILDYHTVIYSYAYRLTGNQPDAEDLTQQTFLVAQQKLDQVREPAKVIGWLSAVLRSSYLKMRRKVVPVNAASLELEVDEIPDIGDDDAFDRELVQIALNELPDDYKLVVLAFYFEECSYQEIAERFSIPIGTVMSRLSRAKSRLRATLLKNDASLENHASIKPQNNSSSFASVRSSVSRR